MVTYRKPRPGKWGLCLEPHSRVQTPEPTCFPPLEPRGDAHPALSCWLPATGLFPGDQAPQFWEARVPTPIPEPGPRTRGPALVQVPLLTTPRRGVWVLPLVLPAFLRDRGRHPLGWGRRERGEEGVPSSQRLDGPGFLVLFWAALARRALDKPLPVVRASFRGWRGHAASGARRELPACGHWGLGPSGSQPRLQCGFQPKLNAPYSVIGSPKRH